MDHSILHQADWWKKTENNTIECQLCPHHCRITSGKTGFCGVRKNISGTLYSLAYGHPVALAVDPIEKKPLAEFLPGSKALSFGTYGCNFNCCFCQNDSLSRGFYDEEKFPQYVPPIAFVSMAKKYSCASIAYTYNEATVDAEYMRDIAIEANKAGIKNVLVTNGFIDFAVAQELYPLMDAVNIDMKGFSEDFYAEMCGGQLKPVLSAIQLLYKLKKHMEITNLVIPGKNDSEEMIASWLDWVEVNLDKKVPLHFTAYFPAYKLTIPPTPKQTLWRIREEALSRGFTSIYLGNI